MAKSAAESGVAMAFGVVLRRRRIQHGYTQEELAAAADITRNYIALLERGARNPSLQTVIALANAFDIRTSKLIRDLEKELSKLG